MKYLIKRTSVFDDETKPIDEAFKEPHQIWHTRTCSEEEFNRRFSHREGVWRSKGTEHKVDKNGNISRRHEDEVLWTVEILTLDDLNKLCEKYGRIIISEHGLFSPSPEIEIYDDYRE